MERQKPTMLKIGEWRVNPASGEISRCEETIRLEARTMRLLLSLAERAGEVVSIDDLLTQVWSGVIVSPDSVYQAVASLRRQLGDDPKQPTYIATVPRLGYQMVAQVRALDGQETSSQAGEKVSAWSKDRLPWLSGTVACVAVILVSVLFFHNRLGNDNKAAPTVIAAQPQKSIAVLPFLDLTEGMKEEEFADGMTEELIDKLSKIPGLRVPAPTSSFYFKNKQVPVAEIAKSLGVAYVIDGSVRKSGTRVRVAARLVRAENGYVIWTDTYDRPFDDIVMVQDDIAGEVTKALRTEVYGAGGTR
jgi:transcriptional activator of cad operon